jgi:hypothetical protein
MNRAAGHVDSGPKATATILVEAEKQIQVEAIAEPKVELDVKAIDWKPWKKEIGKWVNVLEDMELFEEIQKAGGQLEHGGYRYFSIGIVCQTYG